MYRLLIVDDETIIRHGMLNFLDYAEMDIEVVGDTNNGKTALDMIDLLKPDIMFLDVNMPIVSGVDLLKVLDYIESNIKVIMITGYNDFKYMKKAIKYGAFDYILKPVEEQELVECINRAKKEIQSEREESDYYTYVENQLDRNKVGIESKMFLDSIEQKFKFSHIKNRIKFKNSNNYIVCMSYQSITLNINLDKKEISIIDFIRKKLDTIGTSICIKYDDYIVIVINTESDSIKEKILDICKLAEQIIGIYCSFELARINEDDCVYGIFNLLKENITRSNFSPVVMLVKSEIDENYMNSDFRLDDVSSKVQISPSHLSKKFKKEMGQSFKEYLTTVRINKAIELMKNPTIKIYEISEKVGYSTQHYFSSAFKKIVGKSPSEYQRRSS